MDASMIIFCYMIGDMFLWLKKQGYSHSKDDPPSVEVHFKMSRQCTANPFI